MQYITKTLISAAFALAALFILTLSALAQTTGPGDRVLVGIANDGNYNCERNDAGSCLPDKAVQMPNLPAMQMPSPPQMQMPDIPGMPSAGEGGASIYNRESDRPGMSVPAEVSDRYIGPDQDQTFMAILIAYGLGALLLFGLFMRPRRRR